MENVQILLKKITILIPILLIAGLFFWLIGKLLPGMSLDGLLSGKDILPPPRNTTYYKAEISKAPINPMPKDYVEESNFNTSYREPLISYYSSQQLNPLYFRNVTIKKYSAVYSGMVIRGEVKRSFFLLGTFPVFVEDMQKSRSFTQARALEPWSNEDWVKFEVILGKITQKNQCNIVFKNANPSGDARFDIYTSLPVHCI